MKKENVFVGDLIVDKDSVIDYTEVTGYIDVQADVKFPNLKRVGIYVYVRSNTNLKAPALKTVGGYVEVRGRAELPALKAVGGSVTVWTNSELKVPSLKIVGGYVHVLSNSKIKPAALKIVGGSVSAWEGVEFPSIKTVGGTVDVWENVEFPALKTVVGSIDVWDKAELPALKIVGGSVNVWANAELPALTTVGGFVSERYNAVMKSPKEMEFDVPGVEDECRRELMREFETEGYLFADGILSEIVSHHGNVWRVVVCGETEVSYVVSNGEAYSHGKTIKEARDGLIYKIGSRDTSKFKTWTLDRVVSKAEAIEAYRVITGACEAGVRQWVERHKTPDQVTVKEIIDLTKNAYGNKEFEMFFRAEKE